MDHPTETIYYVGIDIGSTASKTVILDETGTVDSFVLPTGWNGRRQLRPSAKNWKKADMPGGCAAWLPDTGESAWIMRTKW